MVSFRDKWLNVIVGKRKFDELGTLFKMTKTDRDIINNKYLVVSSF